MKRMRLNEAVSLLDRDKSRLIGAIDASLTVGLLAAAPKTGGLSLSLFDPKNDVVNFLEDARRSLRSKIHGTTSFQRTQIVSAAHAVALYASYFDELSKLRE